MGEYTGLAVVAVAIATAVDLFVLRTRLVATTTFWISLAIMLSFQVFVDGWLTKRSAPIVSYDADENLGLRVFFDSPLEDFLFGFALILPTLSVWRALARREHAGPRPPT